MDKKRTSTFAIGFLIGLLLCVILWYWQKSTAAEDGALDLLERYAAKERQWREKARERRSGGAEGESTAVSTPLPADPTSEPLFDFIPIKGIGPVFNQRLYEAGITTLSNLLALSADALAELLNVGPSRAQAILAEAQSYHA